MTREPIREAFSLTALPRTLCLALSLLLLCKTASAAGMTFDSYGDWRQISADASYSFEGSSGSYGFNDSGSASPFSLESRLMPFDETFHIVMPGTYTNSILGEVTVTQNSTMDSNEVRATALGARGVKVEARPGIQSPLFGMTRRSGYRRYQNFIFESSWRKSSPTHFLSRPP